MYKEYKNHTKKLLDLWIYRQESVCYSFAISCNGANSSSSLLRFFLSRRKGCCKAALFALLKPEILRFTQQAQTQTKLLQWIGRTVTTSKPLRKVVNDLLNQKILSKEYDGTKIVCDPFTHAENAIAVQKGKDDLLAFINQCIDEYYEDGTYDALWKKWIDASGEGEEAAAEEDTAAEDAKAAE